MTDDKNTNTRSKLTLKLKLTPTTQIQELAPVKAAKKTESKRVGQSSIQVTIKGRKSAASESASTTVSITAFQAQNSSSCSSGTVGWSRGRKPPMGRTWRACLLKNILDVNGETGQHCGSHHALFFLTINNF